MSSALQGRQEAAHRPAAPSFQQSRRSPIRARARCSRPRDAVSRVTPASASARAMLAGLVPVTRSQLRAVGERGVGSACARRGWKSVGIPARRPAADRQSLRILFDQALLDHFGRPALSRRALRRRRVPVRIDEPGAPRRPPRSTTVVEGRPAHARCRSYRPRRTVIPRRQRPRPPVAQASAVPHSRVDVDALGRRCHSRSEGGHKQKPATAHKRRITPVSLASARAGITLFTVPS